MINDIYKICNILKTKSIFKFNDKVEGNITTFKYYPKNNENKYVLIKNSKFIIDKNDIADDKVNYDESEYPVTIDGNKISIGAEELKYLIEISSSFEGQCFYIDADKKFINRSDNSENIVNLSERVAYNFINQENIFALIILFNNEEGAMFPNIRLYDIKLTNSDSSINESSVNCDIALDIAGTIYRNILIFNSINCELDYTKIMKKCEKLRSYNYYSDLSFYNSIISKESILVDKNGYIVQYKCENGISAYKREDNENAPLDVYYKDKYIYTLPYQHLSKYLTADNIKTNNMYVSIRLDSSTEFIGNYININDILDSKSIEVLNLANKYVECLVSENKKKGYKLITITCIDTRSIYGASNFFILYYPGDFIFAVDNDDIYRRKDRSNNIQRMILYDIKDDHIVSSYNTSYDSHYIEKDDIDIYNTHKYMYTYIDNNDKFLASNIYINSTITTTRSYDNSWSSNIKISDTFISETIDLSNRKNPNESSFIDDNIEDNVQSFESDVYYKDDKKYLRYDFGIPILIS